MSESQVSDFRKALNDNQLLHERAMEAAIQIASRALKQEGIEHLPILSRIKSTESACNKAQQKGYKNPLNEMTDIIGLRIVLFLEADLEKCANALRRVFEVDDKHSIDKRKALKSNEFGYQSLHLVCRLGKMRDSLPEYHRLCDMPFEVQVRSALQHTWAEIEHKRGYKGTLALPADLQRRLNAASATLELVDRELSEISRLAEEYKSAVNAKKDSVSDDTISVVALEEILRVALERSGQSSKIKNLPRRVADFVIDEMKCFGIATVDDAQKLTDLDSSRKLFDKRAVATKEPAGITFYRSMMLFADAARFLPCTNGKLEVISNSLYQNYLEIVGDPSINELLEKYQISISESDI